MPSDDDGSPSVPERPRALEASEAGELPPGTTLDRYLILKRLGRGGMGVVYLAFDNELERRVAIKVLRAEATADGSAGETRARLLREAQAMAKVSHPNVVAAYDVGTFGDGVFIAMEYVRGLTLREWLGERKRRARDVLATYLQAGRGLEGAHAAGILHRDFKPENAVIDERGHVKVLDFGLARLDDELKEPESPEKIGLYDTGLDHKAALATPLTRHGAIMGTPAYMAPEQLVGEGASARSDQFAFAVALYEALYGEQPFDGDSVTTRATNILGGHVRPGKSEAYVPRGVRRALLRAMSGSPSKRFASMGDLLDELERAARAPVRWSAAAVVAAVGLALAAAAVLRPAPPKVCKDAAAALAPVWSDARADEVRRAFGATGNTRASEAFEHTRAVLERYAASWVSMRTDACEATRLRGEQSEEGLDLRMACLRQREKEMAATLDLLAHADTKAVDHAVEAAAQLPPVELCSDVASLRAPFAPPRGEAQTRAVDDLRKKLADVEALVTMERSDDAAPAASALVDEAAELGYEPVQAEALLTRGRVELAHEKPQLAEQTLWSAAVLAEGLRYDALAAQTWTLLVTVEGPFLLHFDEGSRCADLADAAARRSGSDVARASVLAARAEAAYRHGETSSMRRDAEECIALREHALGPLHPDTLAARQLLADALWDEGEVEASLPIYTEIHRARAELLGPTDPRTLRSLSDIGTITFELGDYVAAVPMLEESTRHPMRPMNLAANQTYLAQALVGAGRVDEGLALFEKVKTVARTQQGDRSPALASFMSDFARTLALRGLDREAEATAAAGLSLLGPESREQERGEALAVRALCKAHRGDPGAVDDASAALAVKEKLLGERADLVPLLARGEAFLTLHRTTEALADLERALSLGDKYRGDRAIRADVRFALARALVLSKGDAARAADLASRAASALEAEKLPAAAERVRAWISANLAR
jgi:eukaryotic-like serine/threonine-protein kinase